MNKARDKRERCYEVLENDNSVPFVRENGASDGSSECLGTLTEWFL